MITPELRRKYKPTIGIECHVQLKTRTKLFSGASNDAREAAPNSLVNHIDFGLPGALPVLNEEAVRLACRAAFALGTRPQLYSYFERKHYFYPDLPMGYQISQLHKPIIVGGKVILDLGSEQKTIRINRVQIEADAGKSVHPIGKDYSLVDLNRAGTPLLEIVSEADLSSSEEAKLYTRELWLRMRYAGVSDANLYYGNMRFDVNVSVSSTSKLGIRTETKNLNSFRAVEKAIDYEIERQINQLSKGTPVIQETRGWDEAKQKTFSQRTKEEAEDYRYMPDPDLPPIVLSEEYISKIASNMPVMPDEWRKRLSSLGLLPAQIEVLLEADQEFEAGYLSLIESFLANKNKAVKYSNWIVNTEIPLRRRGQDTNDQIQVEPQIRKDIFEGTFALITEDKISSSRANDLLIELLRANIAPANFEEHAQKSGYIQLSSSADLKAIVEKVMNENPQVVNDIKAGKSKAIGFIVGQVMKHSQGQANPKLVNDIILKLTKVK